MPVGERRLRIETGPDAHLFIDFEESGGIYGIELPPEPAPSPKAESWLQRLFRKRG